MRLGLLAVVLASCYQPPQSDESCTITCTEGISDNCPGDLVCEGGYCVGPGQVCRPTFVQTTAGTGFGCALDEQGALWCWGKLTGTDIATRVDATRHWDSIDAGGGQLCGIADGVLLCFGENDNREVSGTVIGDVAEPLQIDATGITSWTAVSAGTAYTCAIGDGQLLCWGKNVDGQLGDGTAIDRAVPTPVAAAITDWTAVATGEQHTCAISTMFGVHCWGRDARGELGPAGTGGSPMPVAVTKAGDRLLATKIAVGRESSCAITPAQEVYCWGSNLSTQLGDKKIVDPLTVMTSAEPVLASDVPGFTEIEGAQNHYCALAADAVYCWGEAFIGGIGAGVWSDRTFAKVIAAGASDISLGSARNPIAGIADLDLSCAIVDGDAQCWGDNRYGQLGAGMRTLTTTPTEVAGEHRFSHIAAGAQHVCGIGNDATLYCWGSTERGQTTGFLYGASNPRTPCAPNPTDPTQPLCDVAEPRALSYAPNPTSVATGSAFTCALSNGVASCWGSGLGGPALKRDLPQPGGSMWKTLLQTGRDGQCGTADTPTTPMYCFGTIFTLLNGPMRVAQLDGFTAIALGSLPNFGVFLDAAGTLNGYGDNTKYQLGDGTMTSYGSLTPFVGRSYTAISTRADGSFVCAIRSVDQKVECWGLAGRGQTGAAATMFSMVPNEVQGLASCTAIAAGSEHACAICDGALQCWGDNRGGQLGADPSDDISSQPHLVDVTLPGDPWTQLVAGSRFTCARSEAGHVYCWGLSEHGALGNGGVGANLPITVTASQID